MLSNQRLYLIWPPLRPPQDNVVCLPPRLAQSLGNMGQVCVCVRVTSAIHLIDPRTLQGEYHGALPSAPSGFSLSLEFPCVELCLHWVHCSLVTSYCDEVIVLGGAVVLIASMCAGCVGMSQEPVRFGVVMILGNTFVRCL